MSENSSDGTTPASASSTTAPSGAAVTSSTDQARSTDGRFEPKEWRYPADYHVEWMRSKTADEVAGISQQLYQEVLRGNPQPQQQSAAPGWQQPQAQTSPQSSSQPPSAEDWQLDPGASAQRYAAYMNETQIAPQLSQYATQLGQTAREIVAQREGDTFRRWGPEIDVLINQLDPRFRSVDNINKVVGMVKANHLDELVNERTQAAIRKAQESGTMRADGGAVTSQPAVAGRIDLDQAGLPDNYRRKLAEYRVTPATLDEFLIATEVGKNGVTLEQARQKWLEQATKGDIITEQRFRMGDDDGNVFASR